MVILLITPIYAIVNRPDLILDTKVLHYFTRQWVKQGHTVHVVHMHFHEFKEIKKYRWHFGWRFQTEQLDGVHVHLMENRWWYSLGFVSRLQKRIAANRVNSKIRQMKKKPNVLLVHLPCKLAGLTENLNLGCPRIAVLHNSDVIKIKKGKIPSSYVRANFDAMGFRSSAVKRKFFEIAGYYDIPGSFVAYSGIPASDDTNQCRNIRKKKLDKVSLLFVGKLIPLKKVDIILSALQKVENKMDFGLAIVGEGQERNNLERLSQEMSLTAKVRFLGKMPREKVLLAMEKSDVFVMVSSPETFGLVYLEAMSRGCITIGSKGEGIDGIIKDGENGFLVEPGNSDALRQCFEKIFNMAERDFERISEKAIKTAEKMTEEKAASDYLSNISKVINKAESPFC